MTADLHAATAQVLNIAASRLRAIVAEQPDLRGQVEADGHSFELPLIVLAQRFGQRESIAVEHASSTRGDLDPSEGFGQTADASLAADEAQS
ncbi:MAG: hypothetical protein O6941_00810 [Planctomycetota bacterium]|nr:hypothetical protein [Planctomycetota bacterium]